MSPRETRFLAPSEASLRVETRADGKPLIVGYAAVFGRLSEDLGGFREKIRPGAFAKILKTADCRALINHDANLILGRNTAGTLRLAEDEIGLRYEIDPPDSDLVKHYMECMRRGDISGSSFSFITGADSWDYNSNPVLRELVEVKELFDVGPVTYPAYPDTTAAVRALEANRPRPAHPGRDLRSLRLRLAEAG